MGFSKEERRLTADEIKEVIAKLNGAAVDVRREDRPYIIPLTALILAARDLNDLAGRMADRIRSEE